jgi:DNA-binding Xre family transcriptional regulator
MSSKSIKTKVRLWNNLFDLCNEREISVYKLHADTGISLNTLYQQANNKADKGYYQVQAKICEYFKCGLDALFDVVSDKEWKRRMNVLMKGK